MKQFRFVCYRDLLDCGYLFSSLPNTAERFFMVRNVLMTSRGAGIAFLWVSSKRIVRKSCLSPSSFCMEFVRPANAGKVEFFRWQVRGTKRGYVYRGAFFLRSRSMMAWCSSIKSLSCKRSIEHSLPNRAAYVFHPPTHRPSSNLTVSSSFRTTRSNAFKPSPSSRTLGKVTRKAFTGHAR